MASPVMEMNTATCLTTAIRTFIRLGAINPGEYVNGFKSLLARTPETRHIKKLAQT
jgi:hypothetical protein